jgi:molybdopterin-containing oxidoreductase family iron-sulfur binding subunit
MIRTRPNFLAASLRQDRIHCVKSLRRHLKPNTDMCGSEGHSNCSKKPGEKGMDRRSFLRNSAVVTSGLAALAASLSPLLELKDFSSMEQFLQKYYKEMTPEEMAKVLKRIEDETEKQYGLRPHVRDLKPMDGVEFVYCLNLTRCIGCRKCVHACVAENNQSRNPEIQYIRVLKMPHGSLDIEKADHNYKTESVPEKGFFYMPVQCQQCKNPPCVKVCSFIS